MRINNMQHVEEDSSSNIHVLEFQEKSCCHCWNGTVSVDVNYDECLAIQKKVEMAYAQVKPNRLM